MSTVFRVFVTLCVFLVTFALLAAYAPAAMQRQIHGELFVRWSHVVAILASFLTFKNMK